MFLLKAHQEELLRHQVYLLQSYIHKPNVCICEMCMKKQKLLHRGELNFLSAFITFTFIKQTSQPLTNNKIVRFVLSEYFCELCSQV